MSPLTTDNLTQVRAIALAAMPDTCALRKVGTIDASGNQTATPTAQDTYACRVDRELNKRGGEAANHGQTEAVVRYVLVLPWNAVVDETMQGTVNGVTYDIVEVAGGGSQAVETRCLVTRTR